MNRKLKVRQNPIEVQGEQLAEEAHEYAHLRHAEREYEARRKEKGQHLLPLMEDLGIRKQKVDFDEEQDATVSVKVRENLKIDADRLKKALGAQTYNKLTSPVLDEAKIEAAIQLGEIDPNVVASCTEEHHTPYLEVRFTKKRKRARKAS